MCLLSIRLTTGWRASSALRSFPLGANYSVSQKPRPPATCCFLTFLTNGSEFQINFYTPITRSYLR